MCVCLGIQIGSSVRQQRGDPDRRLETVSNEIGDTRTGDEGNEEATRNSMKSAHFLSFEFPSISLICFAFHPSSSLCVFSFLKISQREGGKPWAFISFRGDRRAKG